MTIARASRKPSGEILMLGLSRENLTRLQKGQPIHIRRETHGDGIPDGWGIVLFFGETEQEMQKMFLREGLIGPETKVHIDERLK